MSQPPSRTTTPAPAPRRGRLALLGLLLVLTGVVAYFVVALRLGAIFPSVRNDPIALWLVVAAGLALSALAIRRAPGGRRLLPAIVLGLNLFLATTFAAFLYVLLRVPATPGPPAGTAAADFALADQTGRIRRLADWAGTPLLLVFYRGHW